MFGHNSFKFTAGAAVGPSHIPRLYCNQESQAHKLLLSPLAMRRADVHSLVKANPLPLTLTFAENGNKITFFCRLSLNSAAVTSQEAQRKSLVFKYWAKKTVSPLFMVIDLGSFFEALFGNKIKYFNFNQ